MIRARNDRDKVIVLQTSQTHLPESSGLSLIPLTLLTFKNIGFHAFMEDLAK